MRNLALHAYLFIPLYVETKKSKNFKENGTFILIQRRYEIPRALFYSVMLKFLDLN